MEPCNKELNIFSEFKGDKIALKDYKKIVGYLRPRWLEKSWEIND